MRVRLESIAFDAGTQIRAAIDQQVVSDYAEAMTSGATFPPIVLFHDGNQHYLADGFHRFMAAQRNQFKDIDADVRPGTKEDALWFALGANRNHGKQLTPADKKNAVKLAVSTWGNSKSQEAIAIQIGIPKSTVQYHAAELTKVGQLAPRTVIGRDGKNYPTDRRQQEKMKPGEARVRTKAEREERWTRAREMAAEGYSSHQMAAEFGVEVIGFRERLRANGIDVPADRIVGKRKHHDANRIIEQMVMDAENLTADVNLIDFGQVDRERLGEWADALTSARRALDAFIKRLIKEQQKHGEAA